METASKKGKNKIDIIKKYKLQIHWLEREMERITV